MRTPVKTMLCSKLAIATALMVGSAPAMAQSLQGTVGPGSVGASVDQSVPGVTTVNVTQQQAVLNWNTTIPSANGRTTFQPSGTTATFQGASDFAILNRVSPSAATDPIFMGGTVNSLVNGQVGGTVYFYSPNGIVIGSNANFNVGSLGLTTLPIADAQGVWMSGFGTAAPQVTFGPATNPASLIRTNSDGTGSLRANGAGHYVALVAPRIEHTGTIRSDGGVALVAASAATISFAPSGLYSIEVSAGSNDANGIVVDGGRIERNGAAVGGPHRAYLVAVPANNAMLMAIQGGASLGFDIAGSAAVEGNAVVLSAGRDIVAGTAVGGAAGAGQGPASALIDHAAIGSNLIVDTTGEARLTTFNGPTTASGDATLRTSGGIVVAASAQPLTIGGSLTAIADKAVGDGIGGTIAISAQGGQTLAVGRSMILSSDGFGAPAADDSLNAATGTGGSIFVQALGGSSLTVGEALFAHARGWGGNHGFTNGAAGNGVGGNILVGIVNGSRMTVGGATTLDASGVGGSTLECSACSIRGGNGSGGTVNVTGGVRAPGAAASQLNFNGGLALASEGVGGAGDAAAGHGRGGTLQMVTSEGTIVNAAAFSADAAGRGGAFIGSGAGTGGDGTGGDIRIGASDAGAGVFTLGSSVNESVITAQGFGGSATGGTAGGGAGQGGRTSVDAIGAAINFVGDAYLNNDASGGQSAGGAGGSAVGGSIVTRAAGSNVTVGGRLAQLVAGFGGNGVTGGRGEGGLSSATAESGSAIRVTEQLWVDALGVAGDGSSAAGGVGGRGLGGEILLTARTGGTIAAGSLLFDIFSLGGSGFVGGNAASGHGAIQATGGTFDIAGAATIGTDALGGTASGGDGGAAAGGRFELVADGGTVRLAGPAFVTALATGGGSGGAASGGAASGGALQLHARNGGTLAFPSTLFAASDATGGDATRPGARAGDGRGGSVNLSALGGNATIDAGNVVTLSASGLGGLALCGECATGGAGGHGTGGEAIVSTFGGAGNRLAFASSLTVAANGTGSGGHGGAGGNGLGGTAGVSLSDDGQVAVTGALSLGARGDGGFHANGGQAGAGTGGEAYVNLLGGAGSSLTVGASTLLDSGGLGGSSGGIGGAGTGGWSRIFGTGGTALFSGDVDVRAQGVGGEGGTGAGGAGAGGRARFNAAGAAYRVLGNLTLSAASTGGSGASGGRAASLVFGEEFNVLAHAADGGSIIVEGATEIDADALGGTATRGAGGAAQAGIAGIVVAGSTLGNGSIQLDVASVRAEATGGDGGSAPGLAGGAGGDAAGGIVQVSTANSDSGLNRLVIGTIAMQATGTGGDGGRGGDAPTGAAGGQGGAGRGGAALLVSSAGNGRVEVGQAVSDVSGSGGLGGNGGTGSSGAGGRGGDGGVGEGGNHFIGMRSANPSTSSAGSAAYDIIAMLANSIGGDGGDGGSGATGAGAGGHGGAALASDSAVQTRGGSVTANQALMVALSQGGEGGAGSVQGNGGDAFTGNLSVRVTNRFEVPGQRGTLAIGSLSGTAIALGGGGAVAGRRVASGGHGLEVINSSAEFGDYAVLFGPVDRVDPNAVPAFIALADSTVTVERGFFLGSVTDLSVHLDRATLSAGSVLIDAPNIVADATRGAPTSIGTISAGTIDVSSGRDIVLDASLSSGNALALDARGRVAVGNLSTSGAGGAGGTLRVAGTNVTTGTINAGGAVEMSAEGVLSTGAITARDSINLLALGSITTGNLAAGEWINIDGGGAIATGTLAAQSVDLFAVGSIATGNATTALGFDAEAEGALSVGNVSAGEAITLAAQGPVAAGNLSAGLADDAMREGADYTVAILSATSVAVGNVNARDWVGIGTPGTLNAGAIASRNDVLIAANGAIATGAITTGGANRLLVAGADMIALGGPTEAFDRSRLFAALGTSAEAATRGNVTIGGPVSTGRMDALVGGDFTASALAAGSAANATVGGTMTVNGAWASPATRIVSNDLAIGESGRIGGARLDLVSRNATQLLVGDGLGASGYAIDQAEFGRLTAGTVTVTGRGDASAAIDALVGTLGLGSGRSVTIETRDGAALAGVLRVNGTVSGALGASDGLTLAAGRVEVDAATGGILLGAVGSQPSGVLTLSGQRIHVAEGAILDRLAVDPAYAGRDADLARAPATPRPDGVVRAGDIRVDLSGTGPYSVLVQNVGTSQVPAGFTAATAEILLSGGAPGAIDLNVHGQLVTATGTLTGVAVRDALMADDDPARFTASSLINGCALVGPCGAVEVVVSPQPAISSEIALLTTPKADDILFGNEEAIEDNEEEGGEDSESSPISPPSPLFNTKPLEPKGDTDEPVSGGGNPALIGSGPVEGEK